MSYPKSKILKYLFSFTLLLFFLISCSNHPDGVVDHRKMVNFLTDLHKLDGALSAKGFVNSGDRENVYYYNALLEKYGITKAEFDSSLVWYTKNPKKFDKIYNEVIEYLNVEDSILKQRLVAYEDSLMNAVKQIDIWKKSRKFALNKDSVRNKIDFVVDSTELYSQDIYELKFLHRVAPSDSSLNQHAVLRIHYENGITDSVFTKTYNDSILRRYKLHLIARHKLKVERLSGSLLGSSSYKGGQNAIVDSISLTREYNPVIQKEIQQEIEQNKTKLLNIDSSRIRLPHMPKSIPMLNSDKKLRQK